MPLSVVGWNWTNSMSFSGVQARYASAMPSPVLITAFVGFYVGSEAIPNYLQLVQMLFGIALAAGGTLALNQFIEREKLLHTARHLDVAVMHRIERASVNRCALRSHD